MLRRYLDNLEQVILSEQQVGVPGASFSIPATLDAATAPATTDVVSVPAADDASFPALEASVAATAPAVDDAPLSALITNDAQQPANEHTSTPPLPSSVAEEKKAFLLRRAALCLAFHNYIREIVRKKLLNYLLEEQRWFLNLAMLREAILLFLPEENSAVAKANAWANWDDDVVRHHRRGLLPGAVVRIPLESEAGRGSPSEGEDDEEEDSGRGLVASTTSSNASTTSIVESGDEEEELLLRAGEQVMPEPFVALTGSGSAPKLAWSGGDQEQRREHLEGEPLLASSFTEKSPRTSCFINCPSRRPRAKSGCASDDSTACTSRSVSRDPTPRPESGGLRPPHPVATPAPTSSPAPLVPPGPPLEVPVEQGASEQTEQLVDAIVLAVSDEGVSAGGVVTLLRYEQIPFVPLSYTSCKSHLDFI